MTPQEIDQLLRPVPLKDLRVILRSRGINPAGSKESCEERLKEHMQATGDYSLRAADDFSGYSALGSESEKHLASDRTNNYSRPGGNQNIGNHMTGRNSSRVLAPPGGQSQISFGNEPTQYGQPPPQQQQQQQGQYNQGQPMSAPYDQQFAGQQAPPSQGGQQYAAPNSFYSGYDAPPSQGGGGGSPMPMSQGSSDNNYSRPNGMQNVGNFLTDRPSSRVLAPPGGKSQISFG